MFTFFWMKQSTRVGVAFVIITKANSQKYDLLFRSINSVEILFTYSAIIYSVKRLGQANEHCLTASDDIVKYLSQF